MAQVQYSDMFTEHQLNKLQRRIFSVYREAYNEIEAKANAYFLKFEDRYEIEYAKYQAGEYTEEQFIAWYRTQVARGDKWNDLKVEMADRMYDANNIAASYINDTTPSIYTLNHNYELFTIEREVRGVNFGIINEQTVKKLIGTNKMQLLPLARVNKNKDTEWNAKRIQNAILQGIIQGESIGRIATRLESVVNMNRSSAIRNARTAVTNAQNSGKQTAMDKAAAKGIPLAKKWVCTLDDRTRDLHIQLDGQTVDYDDVFRVQGYAIRWPADQTARPEMVYNCRCTMKRVIKGVDYGPRKRWTADRNQDGTHKYSDAESYKEWVKQRGKALGDLPSV